MEVSGAQKEIVENFRSTLDEGSAAEETFEKLVQHFGQLVSFQDLNIKQYAIQRLLKRFNEFVKHNPILVLARVDDPIDKRKTLVGLVSVFREAVFQILNETGNIDEQK